MKKLLALAVMALTLVVPATASAGRMPSMPDPGGSGTSRCNGYLVGAVSYFNPGNTLPQAAAFRCSYGHVKVDWNYQFGYYSHPYGGYYWITGYHWAYLHFI